MKKEFIGDWLDLADLWGIPKQDDDEELAYKIKRFVYNHLDTDGLDPKLDPKIKQDIHDFLDSLIEGCSSFDKPMYEAMRSLEEDHALVRWFCNNLTFLWE